MTRHRPSSRLARRSRRGFTLVEVIIVLAIIAILAAMAVPSLSGLDHRRTRLAVDEVEALLAMYAYRDSVSSNQVALWRDSTTSRLVLLAKEPDPYFPEAQSDWKVDRFTEGVDLPYELAITDVRIDDRRQNLGEFLITRVPGQSRPLIEIDLEGPGISVTLSLPPLALAPIRFEAGEPPPAVQMAVDLDREGRFTEEW